MSEPIARKNLPEAADPVARVSAKLIDALIAAALSKLAAPFGMVLGLLYLLASDSLPNGQSVGKRILGLRAVDRPSGLSAHLRQSALRNALFGVLYVFAFLPPLGYVLLAVLGTFVLAVEFYAIFRDPNGLRMGDLFAQTQVVGPQLIAVAQGLEPGSTPP